MRVALLASLSALVILPAAAHRPPESAAGLVTTAMDRMGGMAALERLVRVRREMVTQWQRTSFASRPYADGPSYETHSDVRDYAVPAWRNTRKFPTGGTWREITDIVRDSVGIRRLNDTWTPLNVAYLDERREVFTFAPERLLLHAAAATDLAILRDTLIDGAPHARVRGTVNGFPTTIFFRRSDGLPALVRYVAGQPNDFGLAPWGVMEVELWYSRWARTAAGVALPLQWDVRRAGEPYKRMTVLSATYDSVAPADSFLVSDSLRGAFLQQSLHAMHDLPLDSATMVEPGLAAFKTPGAPVGAVRLGRQWVLLETGQAPFNAERAGEWLAHHDPGARVAMGILTDPGANAGLVSLARQRVPVVGAAGAAPFVATYLANHGGPRSGFTGLRAGRWFRVDGDSLWVEPIELTDYPGAALVYVPSLRWVYSRDAVFPFQGDQVAARVRERGWAVERWGNARALVSPFPSR